MPVKPHVHLVSSRPESVWDRTAIVVDAACDVPAAFLQQSSVLVLPTEIEIGEFHYTDNRDPATTERFLRDNLGTRSAEAETQAFSSQSVRSLFLERLVLDYDSVYCLTISAKRSEIYENTLAASIEIAPQGRAMRNAAGLAKPFMLRVIDTRNLFAGQGAVALELAAMVGRGMPPRDVVARLSSVIDSTYGYFVPDDLYFLRARAKKKGDRSVGLLGAMMGGVLDIKPIIRAHAGVTEPAAKVRGRDEALNRLLAFTARRVEEGLLTPHVNLSYGGDLAEIRNLKSYIALAKTCAAHKVHLHESIMSITGMVNVGPRGLGIGFSAPPHAPEF